LRDGRAASIIRTMTLSPDDRAAIALHGIDAIRTAALALGDAPRRVPLNGRRA
jgi:hypothetical protein